MNQSDPFGPDIESKVREHARQQFPKESCGFILKDGRYLPLPNLAENPEQEFAIDSKHYVRHADNLACVVHSHPNGPAHPSEMDMQMQRDTSVPWGIVVLNADGKDREIFYWGDFDEPLPLIGRQFRHGVSDCYALVRDWYWKACGVRLPMGVRRHEWWEEDVQEGNLFFNNYERANLVLLESPELKDIKIGDIIVGKIAGKVPNHCGVYIGNNQILHHFAGRLSKRDLINTLWRFRVWVFRYRGELIINESFS